MSLSIRRASPADAASVAKIAAETFVETFGHLYPPQDLAHFLNTSYALQTQRAELEHPAKAMWLLEDDGVAVGHVFAGPNGLPHPEAAPEDGEIKRLYLLKPYQGGGWGAKLFETALDWLEQDGPRTIHIGVWSQNVGAQRFYARYGFEKIGGYLFPVGNTLDDEFILRRMAGWRE